MEILISLKFWIIIGLLLSITEIFTGIFLGLSLGISAFIMAIVFYFFPNLFEEWYEILFVYSIFSIAVNSLFWYWKVKVKKPKRDINDQF
jgi:membrane protein implicated in regulation of membrane protease activity